MSLTYKPDFEQAVERFEAWWRGELLDRPPVTLAVKPTRPYDGPASNHATLRERWMDVPFQVEAAEAELARRPFVAESFPIYNPNLGPDITGTLFGCDIEFGEDTSWATHVVHDVSQWNTVIARAPDFDNVYWQTIEAMTDLALERLSGKALVGMTDLHGSYDMLASLRDPQMLCIDLMDDRERVDRAARAAAKAYIQALERQLRTMREAGMGSTCWASIFHDGAAYVPSCDFWCLIDGELATELVVPRLVEEMRPMARSLFHLDGPTALRHLDLVLELPGLDAVQWVYGAGQGPASKWIDTYKRCLDHGKAVEVLAETAADALTVLEALGPRGVWLFIEEEMPSVAEAEAFLGEVDRLSSIAARR